ncbi:A disintegrin and metalloproteinase with thrombospondin motifs 7-like isoform X4 [Dreissena polymorpha]|uniref:A disintegrin and metalloproteinase with thrombospondin motifs 7-like isoform X4 n=1 Tax=Dreissena polymorpha TaxID=45954 RepID=UPI0022651E5C|nr:A disintegrin and metalloproteinase with thrombospondin motifs 7-like isoform X4 [Dreissena polymorpha]
METVVWNILYACSACFTLDSIAAQPQDAFLAGLDNYDVIIPSRVFQDGGHMTYSLHPAHKVHKRSAGSLHNFDTIHYNIDINNQPHVLQLELNQKLLSEAFVIERMKNKFKNVTDSSFSRLHDSKSKCHFHGHIIGHPGSTVALGLCNGMTGFIRTADDEYLIEPLQNETLAPDGRHRHVLYRRSALPARLTYPGEHSVDEPSCGINKFEKQKTQRERWERHVRRRETLKPRRRRKRSFSTERYVETLVVVDPSMVKYHNNEHLETYVLSIMNMVSVMFHDGSIGNSVNIVLVRLLLVEEDQDDLLIAYHADKTLNSFCKFQKKINFKDDDHPNHHDVAVLLTRKNICSRLNEPCGTLGLAQVWGMCQPHRSCSISEDTGLALAYTVTHELGHNFGMPHDGESNGCLDPPGMQLFIMSPSLVVDSRAKFWSNCSEEAITSFFDRDWGYCLDDEPTTLHYDLPILPPGTMYDAEHQCRLQYGTDNATVCTNEQDVCTSLWCRTDNRCSTHLEAAAEGTICGTNKWCYQGACVEIGDRPGAIDGEWGQWTHWSQCSRSCGAGVEHSQRHCDNPAPSHGGKYCLGERKKFRICNTEECPDEITFNQVQCEGFNYVPYRGGLYEWEHVPSPETPCQLHCKPKTHFFSVLLKDIVEDGTPCTAGTRNICISGRCRHIGCDYVIDSSAREDRCGVCHGDGTTCTTVKEQYNESQGLGYVEAGVIPKGARNIRVEEVAEAINFLALQNDQGEYYLNGHWFIQWSGDYTAAGTIIRYSRVGNKETVNAAGPTKEPLHVMLLLQSTNPGVVFEYTIPKTNITELRAPEFHWVYQPWTHCTASCGGGSQRSEVVCTELEGDHVEDRYCNVTNKPDDKQRVCNVHLCPARWWSGPWQHCSVTCGDNGVRFRTVMCVRSLGPEEQIALNDDACDARERPQEMESCHPKPACLADQLWQNGDWSKCSVSCGEGFQSREVWCVVPGTCVGAAVPEEERPCTSEPCPPSKDSTTTTTVATLTSSIETMQSTTTRIALPTSQSIYIATTDIQSKSVTTTDPTQTLFPSSQPMKSSGVNSVNENPSDTSSTSTTTLPGKSPNATTMKVASLTDAIKPNGDRENKTEHAEYDDDVLEENISITADVIFATPEPTGAVLPTSTVTVVNGAETNATALLDVDFAEARNETYEIDGDAPKEINASKNESVPDSKYGPDVHNNDNSNITSSILDTGIKAESNKMQTNANEGTAIKLSDLNIKLKPISDENALPILPDESEQPPMPAHLPDGSDLPPLPAHLPDKSVLPPLPAHLPDVSYLPPLPGHLPYESDLLPTKGHLPDDQPHLPDEIPPLLNGPLSVKNDLSMLPKELLNLQNNKDLPNVPGINQQPTTDNTLMSVGNILPSVKDNTGVTSSENGLNLASIRQETEVKIMKQPDFKLNTTETVDKGVEANSNNIDTEKFYTNTDTHETITEGLGDIQSSANVKTDDNSGNSAIKHAESYILETFHKDNLAQPTGSGFNETMHLDVTVLHSDSVPDVVGTMPVLKVDVQLNFKWIPSDWSECSRKCGGGVRTRTVDCVERINGVGVVDAHCDINMKPPAIEDCNSYLCLEWTALEWGECSSECGPSVRRRQVSCPNEGHCDPHYKPISEEQCDTLPCIMWVAGQWSSCTRGCGGGEQLRVVQCVHVTSQQTSAGCDIAQQPPDSRECNTEPCQENNAALSIECEYNEMSSLVCRTLKRMGQCQKRFVALKCCRTCAVQEKRTDKPTKEQ